MYYNIVDPIDKIEKCGQINQAIHKQLLDPEPRDLTLESQTIIKRRTINTCRSKSNQLEILKVAKKTTYVKSDKKLFYFIGRRKLKLLEFSHENKMMKKGIISEKNTNSMKNLKWSNNLPIPMPFVRQNNWNEDDSISDNIKTESYLLKLLNGFKTLVPIKIVLPDSSDKKKTHTA